jgi:phage shock protein PspC (stress-responsive transcriptional regulator)
MSKRLYLSNDKMLGGVCGGIAEYFGIDPTLVRLISLVLIITTAFTGFLVYIGAWFIIPKKPMF